MKDNLQICQDSPTGGIWAWILAKTQHTAGQSQETLSFRGAWSRKITISEQIPAEIGDLHGLLRIGCTSGGNQLSFARESKLLQPTSLTSNLTYIHVSPEDLQMPYSAFGILFTFRLFSPGILSCCIFS